MSLGRTKCRIGGVHDPEGQSNYIAINHCLSELNLVEARFMVLRDSNILHAVFSWFIEATSFVYPT